MRKQSITRWIRPTQRDAQRGLRQAAGVRHEQRRASRTTGAGLWRVASALLRDRVARTASLTLRRALQTVTQDVRGSGSTGRDRAGRATCTVFEVIIRNRRERGRGEGERGREEGRERARSALSHRTRARSAHPPHTGRRPAGVLPRPYLTLSHPHPHRAALPFSLSSTQLPSALRSTCGHRRAYSSRARAGWGGRGVPGDRAAQGIGPRGSEWRGRG